MKMWDKIKQNIAVTLAVNPDTAEQVFDYIEDWYTPDWSEMTEGEMTKLFRDAYLNMR